MVEFAVLEGIKIINVIVAETKQIAEEVTNKPCVELPPLSTGIGWTYENGIFTAPVEIPPTNLQL